MGLLQKVFIFVVILQVSSSVRVTLEGAQTATVKKEAKATDTVTLQCSASPTVSAGTPTVEWTFSTDPRSEGTHLYYSGAITRSPHRFSLLNPYNLMIRNLVSSDAGYYKCRVVIPGDTPSTDSGQYHLTVLVPPNANVSCGFPEDRTLTAGTNASFNCHEVNAVADPAPTYKWFKNGQELPTSSTDNELYANSTFSYSSSDGMLEIQNVSASDAGEYYCVVSNRVGSEQCDDASNITLYRETSVPPNPNVSCGFPEDRTLTVGINASFHCHEVNATAVPAPTYKWFKNGKELPTSSADNELYANSTFSYNSLDGMLEILNASASDAGEYYCVVSNRVGSERCDDASNITLSRETSDAVFDETQNPNSCRNLKPSIRMEVFFLILAFILMSSESAKPNTPPGRTSKNVFDL